MIGDRAGTLLELLIGINRDVAGALDLKTVLRRLLLAAVGHVGGERGSIVVVDDTGIPVDATIVYGTRLLDHTTKQLKETVDRGLAGWVLKNRKPALLPNTSLDERWLRRRDDASDQSGAKSALCVPLIARERIVGVLTIVHSVPNAFGTEHLQLAEAIADQASIAVLNARLYGQTSRQARIMTALADGATAFSSSLDLHEVRQHVLEQTIQALEVETAAIGLLHSPDEELVFEAAAGVGAGSILGWRASWKSGLTGYVLRERRGVIIPNTTDDPRYAQTDRCPGIDGRAIAMVPIQSQGRVIGVLQAINPVSGKFDPDALTVMMGMGGLAGTTISNAQLFEQLQRAHKHYLELFEESIDPILVTDREGKITDANRQAGLLTMLPPETLRSMSIGQIHQVNWHKVGMHFEILRQQGRAHYEASLRAADGRVVPMEVHAHAMEFAAADSILWRLHDLTERKQLDELRQNLTSMIYHDLRSPLGNLVSSLGLLREMSGQDQNARAALEIAERSTERMSRLVNSLLDINQLESGHAINTREATTPSDLVQRSVEDVIPTTESRGQRIRTRISEGLPEIRVDSDMVRRVLFNLLENAAKFSPPGSEIEIGARAEASTIQFWVKDQGPGIPAADQERIYEKFARLDRESGAQSGLGLGLAFCQIAVRAHKGSIRVIGTEGQGSTFIVTLPKRGPSV